MMGNSETWKWWLRKGHIYKTYRIYQQDLGWGEEKVKEVFAFPRFSGIEQCFLNLTNPKNHLDQKLSFGGLKTKVLPLSLTQNRWLVTKQWKRPQRAPSSLLPCEDSGAMAIYVPGSGPSPDTDSAGAVILDFSPKTVRSKCLLFTTHWVSGRLLQQTEQLRQFTSIINSIIQY